MLQLQPEPALPVSRVRSACPRCSTGLKVLKIIPGRVGRGGCEYWTMRCIGCGDIHLDIVEPADAARTK